jgi:cell division protein FtsI/penicillin-binding protein 2
MLSKPTPQSKKSNKAAVLTWRVRLLQICFTLIFGLILGRVVFLQTMKAASLQKNANNQRIKSNPTTIFRGEIVDCNGVTLAVDTARYDLFVRPKQFRPTDQELHELSELLNIPAEKLDEYRKLRLIKKIAVSLKRHQADKIAKLKLAGLDLVPVNNRSYPHDKLAAHLLGFVSWDSTGKAGIEQSLEENLSSASSLSKPLISRGDGRPIIRYASLKPIISSAFGQQVVLTIDSKLQYKVEQILDQGVNKFQASKATALVINPSNGEILAWANSPSYNPNTYSKYSPGTMVNWAINQIYEPGSTFKIITVASALDSNAIKQNYRYLDTGKLTINNRTIKNHDCKDGAVKEIGLVELFRYSSNTAAADVGMRMDAKDFYEKLKKFGIASKTGIEIPGESAGVLKDYSGWQPIDRATTSFGQGAVAVTPIQLAAAVNVIANKGYWVQPHLIKSVKSSDGQKTIKEIKPEKRKVISSKVAKMVSMMLAESIKTNLEQDSSYMAGNIPNYEVAGKTGTAQKYCPKIRRYCPGETIASFIGFFPVEDPKFLILVVVDSPKAAGGWGNTVAGPIFNEIGETVIKMYPGAFTTKNILSLNP